MADSETATDDSGQYSFTGLRAGTYSVEISGFDSNEVSFSSTSGAATVGVGESKVVSFDGTYLRTAGIMGQVSVEGEGLGGVTVTLMGQGAEATEMTDAGGLYSFSQLRSGDYTVAISGYDTDDYEFETTSKSVTIATGETANVPFDGTLLRTAGIAGRVSVGGMGLDDVEVTLKGAAEMSAMTSNGGQYSFAGLAAGTYVVSISNPNDVAYSFETTSMNVELMDDQSAIVNFEGTHTRTASVSGTLFIDEVMQDKMHNEGEPSVAVALAPLLAAGVLKQEVLAGLLDKAKVKLRGPDLNTMQDIDINLDGTFSTGATLMAGSYQVELPVNDDEVAAGLAAAGIAFVGESMVVTVEAGGSATVNFPFRITMQTLMTGAAMGNAEETGAPVADVELALYANADMTGMLGEATTDSMGMATFNFARDANTGPAGHDNIVFIKVKSTGHDALAVSENDFTEVSYAATDRASSSPAAVKLVNVMANFQFWVKSDADARGGDMGLGDWATEVTMGKDTIPLTMVDEDGDTVNATMPTDTAMASRGRAGLSYTVEPGDLPATFTVTAAETQAEARGEKWEQSDALTHTHTGLVHPDMNTAEMNDLGPIYVTYTTQKLTVGVYREVDDEPGWTDYRAPMGGDKRPEAAVAAKMSAQLMTRDSRNRLRPYEYDHDGKATTDPISSMDIGSNGMATFSNLPATEELTVRFHVGSNRTLVGETDIGDVDAFGQDLDIGMSHGSFGDEGGAMPEVKLCSLSTDEDEDKCATFAYQWKTGSITGNVAGPGGASVSLSAETEAEDRSTKTSAKTATLGDFSINNIQDGEYTLTTPNTADNSFSPKGGHKDLEIYHNEKGEKAEGDESEYVGTAWARELDFTATKLRLSIKGYVVNDSNNDDRARGIEAQSGVDVNLLQIAKDGVSKDKKDTTFTKVATTSTDASGLYEFNDLTEREKYFVEVPAGDGYMGLRDHADGPNNKSGEVEADEYPEKEEGSFALPNWNHASNTASNTSVEVSADPPNTNNIKAKFENFALVYTNATVMGSVTDASGNSAGITVAVAICGTYTPDDPTTTGADEDEEDCAWSRGDIVSTRTAKGGDFEISGLMEGYYEVWWEGGGLAAANLTSAMKIDDDAVPGTDGATTSPTEIITSVVGRNQYSTNNNFHVYSTGLRDGVVLDSLAVVGIEASGDTTNFAAGATLPTTPDASGTDALTLTGTPTVTWAAAGVTITTGQSPGATAKATLSTAVMGRSPTDLPYNKTGSDNAGTAIETGITVTVTAENGYNDHEYTFSVTRAAPVGHPADFTADGTTVTFTDGTVHNEAVVTDNSSADIVVSLVPSQGLAVTVGEKAVTCTTAGVATVVHTCTVSGLTKGGSTAVKVEITSEDSIKASMIVNLQRASS